MKKIVFSALIVSVLGVAAYSVMANDSTPKKKKSSCCTSQSADSTSKGCCKSKTK